MRGSILHATCAYWVNAMGGHLFFLVSKDIDPGLLNALEQEVVPRLEKEVPLRQPQAEFDKDPSTLG